MGGEDVPLIISWASEREKLFGILSVLKRGLDACEVRPSYAYCALIKVCFCWDRLPCAIASERGEMQIPAGEGDRLHGN